VPTVQADDGAAIAYEVHGDGPSLVLVHGITECRRSWDPLIERLGADHRVVAVDLRGHGESDRRAPFDAFTLATDLHAVIDDANATDPVLVGHSLGGSIVSLYASFASVRAVVNVDQPLALGGFKDSLASIEPLLRGDAATFDGVVAQLFDDLYGPLEPSERARVASHAHPEQEVVLGVWNVVLETDAAGLDAMVATAARSVTAPYLALHGTDPGNEYRDWVATNLPAAKLEVWPEHGHYPHLVDQDRFLRRLREFEASL
jgi:pimeloyl-ACP methyl ester carboxylesterase